MQVTVDGTVDTIPGIMVFSPHAVILMSTCVPINNHQSLVSIVMVLWSQLVAVNFRVITLAFISAWVMSTL